MTNLEKLKQLFPNDWNQFYANIGWFNEAYQIPPLKNIDIFNYYFKNADVSAQNTFWEEEYKNG